MNGTLRVTAPAKVNFRLDVLRKRPDGYHDLRMIMQRIDLCDELTFSLRQEPGISLTCQGAALPDNGDNIVWKAAVAMLARSGKNCGIAIDLRKRIPVGAGLGGGSSDAAATLMALNDLLEAGLTDEQLMTIGTGLGADVPFFIFKQPAVAEGIGDRLTPLQGVPRLWLLLVNPGIHVDTASVYGNLRLTSEKVAAKLPFLYKSAVDVRSILANDLEAVTLQRYPVIREIKDRLVTAGAGAALMSGSGSTVFALFDDQQSAVATLESLSCPEGWFTSVVATI